MTRYVGAAAAPTLEALLRCAEACSSADDGCWAALERLLCDDYLLGRPTFSGLGDLRNEGKALLKERERIAAATAKRAALAQAVAAAAAQRGSLEEDTYAKATYSAAPPKQRYPQEFNGTQEHTDAEIAAANRHLVMGLMLEPDDMSPGQRALHDALPAEEQVRWVEVRAYLREQKASAVKQFK